MLWHRGCCENMANLLARFAPDETEQLCAEQLLWFDLLQTNIFHICVPFHFSWSGQACVSEVVMMCLRSWWAHILAVSRWFLALRPKGFVLFDFCGHGNWTKGFVRTRQVLSHWVTWIMSLTPGFRFFKSIFYRVYVILFKQRRKL